MPPPAIHDDARTVADAILDRLDGRVVLALPLGLGKAVSVANALFDRAAADRAIDLSIFTALTLEKPRWSSDLERRFVEPLSERLFPDYRGLRYAEALRGGGLPENIRVSEFFFLAGRWLGIDRAQQDYVSANYTHAGRYVLERGVNVVAQLVACRGEGADARYSLSCNTDITLDILPALKAREAPFLMVGEVSTELPFMTGEAVLGAEDFDLVLDGPGRDRKLFVVPKSPVSAADHAVGIHAASLVKDGGTLQIGIGALGDALAAALVFRQRDPALFARTLSALAGDADLGERETGPFEAGLYAASEMFVDAFMPLYREGVLKRRAGDGAILHSGFFLGTEAFYRFLRELPEAERDLFRMRGIGFVNELYGDEAQKRRDRVHARFVNNAMMVTLLGAVVSDALESGKVVSGVGGQYNFVAQAFALEGARSVIALNATRDGKGGRESRLVWSYGHATIPRHLRDMVVTEYGVADLRGRTDAECVAAMLEIADREFQDSLLGQARARGKIGRGHRIAPQARHNTPARIEAALGEARAAGWCRAFPFGTEFTETEQAMLPALERLRAASASPIAMARLVAASLGGGAPDERQRAALKRMGLAAPTGLRERLYARLLTAAMRG